MLTNICTRVSFVLIWPGRSRNLHAWAQSPCFQPWNEPNDPEQSRSVLCGPYICNRGKTRPRHKVLVLLRINSTVTSCTMTHVKHTRMLGSEPQQLHR